MQSVAGCSFPLITDRNPFRHHHCWRRNLGPEWRGFCSGYSSEHRYVKMVERSVSVWNLRKYFEAGSYLGLGLWP